MGTSAGSGGTTSGPATPVGAGGAAVPAGAGGAVPAGTTGNATATSGTTGGGVKAHTQPVRGVRRENPLNEQENPEADEFIAKGKQDKKDRIAKAKAAAQEGAQEGETASPVAFGKPKGGKK